MTGFDTYPSDCSVIKNIKFFSAFSDFIAETADMSWQIRRPAYILPAGMTFTHIIYAETALISEMYEINR